MEDNSRGFDTLFVVELGVPPCVLSQLWRPIHKKPIEDWKGLFSVSTLASRTKRATKVWLQGPK